MKKYTAILTALLPLLVSCSEIMEKDTMSTIPVRADELETKVQMIDWSTVWNHNDRLGVFFIDGAPEQWTYLGEDKSRTGSIGGITHHSLSQKKYALYPYSNKARLQNGTISTSIDGNPVLVASSENDGLCFSYACSCIALRILGSGTLTHLSLISKGGEQISGDISINISDASNKATLVKGVSDRIFRDVILPLSEAESVVCFYLPPVSLSKGFSVDCTFQDSTRFSYEFPSELELSQGTAYIYDLRTECLEEDIWDFDFRYENTLGLPASYSQGIFNGDTGYPEGKTFSTADGKELTFYTIDGKDDKGTLGVKYNITSGTEPYNWMQMGRVNSYIKIHGREGYSIKGVFLTPRNGAGSPYFSLTPDGYSSISAKYYGMEAGEEFYVPLSGVEDGRPCYMMVSSSMVSLFGMKIKYVSVKE